MPHQIYTPSGGRTEHSEEQHPHSASFDSTHFDDRSPNPLYHTTDDLHFPVNAELNFDSDYYSSRPSSRAPVPMVQPVQYTDDSETDKVMLPSSGLGSINA